MNSDLKSISIKDDKIVIEWNNGVTTEVGPDWANAKYEEDTLSGFSFDLEAHKEFKNPTPTPPKPIFTYPKGTKYTTIAKNVEEYLRDNGDWQSANNLHNEIAASEPKTRYRTLLIVSAYVTLKEVDLKEE